MRKVNDATMGITKIVGFTLVLGYGGTYICNKLTVVIVSAL